MRSRPFPEMQRFNPFRKPAWRWERAVDLVDSGRYYSAKRDDVPTGIAVAYLRDIRRCRSDLRLRRVRERYEYVHRAKEIWEARDERRLEIEARILARQSDVAIGLEMGLPAATIQCYRDLLFDIDDRIDASGYILCEVIGIRPYLSPSPTALMLASAYVYGPPTIEPWMRYLREGHGPADLTTEAGRAMEQIDVMVAVHSLPDTSETQRSLTKLSPILFQNASNSSQSGSVAGAFANSTAKITARLDLSASSLPPFAYRPASPQRHAAPINAAKQETRKAA